MLVVGICDFPPIEMLDGWGSLKEVVVEGKGGPARRHPVPRHGQHEGRYGSAPEEGRELGRRESQGELRRLGRRGRVGRSGRAQRAGAGGGGALTGGDFDPGRASAYISHAMALYRPERSSPTV